MTSPEWDVWKANNPAPTGGLCRVCGMVLAPSLVKQGIHLHPLCDTRATETLGRNRELKDKLTEIILWADRNSPRSKQVAIGPSEIGDACDQKIARILANAARVNFRGDPWAAIVGTAVHAWLEGAVKRFQAAHPSMPSLAEMDVATWRTEMEVYVDEMITGHSDLYSGDSIDYKTSSKEGIASMRLHGPSLGYRTQGHIYGLAHHRAGRPIRDVVIVWVPRAGRLNDMYLWREPFDLAFAEAQLKRMYDIAFEAIRLDVLNHPENWAQIPTNPGAGCWYCPFFVDRDAEVAPDASGCPGNSKPHTERLQAAKDRFGSGVI